MDKKTAMKKAREMARNVNGSIWVISVPTGYLAIRDEAVSIYFPLDRVAGMVHGDGAGRIRTHYN